MRREREASYYDVAQVCLNGHVVNSMTGKYPQRNEKFCSSCGESTITRCRQCNSPIRGYYHIDGAFGHTYQKPFYCHNCGSAYPWTQRVLEAATEYIMELDVLDENEKELLRSSIEPLTKDGPQTVVAESRFKKLVKRAGTEAGTALRDILVDIVSESVRKSLFP